jgi:hypothetical protein
VEVDWILFRLLLGSLAVTGAAATGIQVPFWKYKQQHGISVIKKDVERECILFQNLSSARKTNISLNLEECQTLYLEFDKRILTFWKNILSL